MFNICDIHIGCLSSIIHAPLLLKKKYINISNKVNPPETFLQTDHIFNSKNIGIEDNTELWMRSFNFTNIQQLKDLFPKGIWEKVEKNNNIIWDTQENLLQFFDDFNDKNAGKRIIDYILKDEK